MLLALDKMKLIRKNKNSLNIAIFTDTYLPQINGVVTSTVTFAEEFEKMGHNVIVIAPRVAGEPRFSNKLWRFRSITLPFIPEQRVSMPWSRKLKEFKNLDIDIIHAQTPFTMGYIAQRMAKKNNIPIVHTYHTFFAEYIHYIPLIPKSIMKKYAKKESQRFCNNCQYIVAPSYEMKEKIIEYGVKAPLEVIPTGINLHKLNKNINVPRFRLKWNLSNEDKLLIFVGRLALEKNIFFLLDAFKHITETVPNSKLFIAGDGPERHRMEKYVAKQKLSKQVIFSGYLDRKEVFEAFSASDLCLFPSKTETQGLIVVESLAAGTPVIGIKAMGVKDILQNDQGGYLTSENKREFADKAIQVLTSKELYKKKKEEALARAQAYSATALAEKMIAVFQKSMARV